MPTEEENERNKAKKANEGTPRPKRKDSSENQKKDKFGYPEDDE